MSRHGPAWSLQETRTREPVTWTPLSDLDSMEPVDEEEEDFAEYVAEELNLDISDAEAMMSRIGSEGGDGTMPELNLR